MGRYRYNVYDGERRIGTGLLPAQVGGTAGHAGIEAGQVCRA